MFTLLKQDVFGTNGFGVWAFSFFIIGAVGYIPALKRLSDVFLLLVLIVIVIANNQNGRGFFQQLADYIKAPTPNLNVFTNPIGGVTINPIGDITGGYHQ